MPVVCICQWQNCAAYSAVFKEANHVLSGFFHVLCGPRNVHVRKMIEQHLSISDGVVNQMIIYTVAYHHWPEQLIMKNKNEKRGISKLIYREEALHYGIQFVESSELSNDDVSSFILNNESNRMYIQAPSVSETDVSNLIATFYSTPTKRTVDCGIPFPFFVDEPPNPIGRNGNTRNKNKWLIVGFHLMFPSKLTLQGFQSTSSQAMTSLKNCMT
jgi:hypothetical protein